MAPKVGNGVRPLAATLRVRRTVSARGLTPFPTFARIPTLASLCRKLRTEPKNGVQGRGPWRGASAHLRAAGLASAVVIGAAVHSLPAAETVAAYRVDGDAILEPLDNRRGDQARGERIVRDREVGNCLICHALPIPEERFQGEIGPDLAGIADRLSAGQIRLRLVDQTQLNPATIMPPYYRIEGLDNVAERYRGRPVLSAQEIEDIVAYLMTLH